MDTNQYIESGILETYVMGLCSDTENQEVEKLISQYSTIATEVDTLRDKLEDYASLHAITPPFGLKNRILATLETQNLIDKPAAKQMLLLAKPLIKPWHIAAGVSVLAMSAAFNVYFYNNWKQSETALSSLQAENTRMAGNLDIQKASYTALNQEFALVQSAEIKKITLAGTPASPSSSAKVYWNNSKNEVYLSVVDLPQIKENQQYQLWAIVDGKPVDAGIFNLGTGLVQLKNISNASAFAISLEAKGGSTTQAGPKGTIYLMGAV